MSVTKGAVVPEPGSRSISRARSTRLNPGNRGKLQSAETDEEVQVHCLNEVTVIM